jgi:hypothetical protein
VNYIIPERIKELQYALNAAIASVDMTDFAAYKNDLANVANIRAQLDTAMNEDPVLGNTVLDVTTYNYNKAYAAWETAAGDFYAKAIAAKKAQNVVNDTFKDYQVAITKLFEYETDTTNVALLKEVYHVDADINTIVRPLGVYKDNELPVAQNTLQGKSVVDRSEGQWVCLQVSATGGGNFVPELRNGAPRECIPNKRVAYDQAEIKPYDQILTQQLDIFNVFTLAASYPVDANGHENVTQADFATVTDIGKNYPYSNVGNICYVMVDGERLPVVKHFDNVYGVTATIAHIAPVSLYAKEEASKATVNLLAEDLAAATKAQVAAQEALDAAEAEYVAYHGYKPSDDPQPTPTPDPKPIPTQFTDVKADDWFAGNVGSIVEKKIMNGMSKTFFGSYSPLQRQDFAVILYRMAGEPPVTVSTTFIDVDKNDYYAKAVSWAASLGIVKGYADTGFTVFGVGDDITREDFCVMLYRYFGYPEPTGTLDGFADANTVSSYAAKAVKWAVENGALTGKTGANGEKLIAPQDKIVRAEAAKIIDIITDNN